MKRYAKWIGLLLVGFYWFWLHPPGFGRQGYVEDIGHAELTRSLMADAITRTGGPAFTSERIMAPEGTSVAFASWIMERDWPGGYLFNWNPDFPWLWVYFGLSLFATYFAIGWIMRKMMPDRPASPWFLAAFFVLMNVPRHYKIYHHYEHIVHHWVYLSLFLDAWILHRVWKDRSWSLNLEAWRAFCLLAMLGTGGYYWGPLIFEWAIARLALLARWLLARRKAEPVALWWRWRAAIAPALVGGIWVGLVLRWYLPLVAEVKKLGEVWSGIWWYADFRMMLRPAGLEPLVGWLKSDFPSIGYPFESGLRDLKLYPIDLPETVVTMGWIYWLLLGGALVFVARRRGGLGFGAALPFLLFFLFGVAYTQESVAGWFQPLVQKSVPFMEFFRVASRMGLFFPAIVAAIVALGWPGLSDWLRGRRWAWAALGCVIAIEASSLAVPVSGMQPLRPETRAMFEAIREEPGTTVLDMPFCTAGGNTICTGEQCPIYPYSTLGSYLGGYHGKAVYGAYLSRRVPSQCKAYEGEPYRTWFDAWSKQRCLEDHEWESFCAYLEGHQELSAVLVYYDLWSALRDPACDAKLRKYLGEPRQEEKIDAWFTRGAKSVHPGRIRWYSPRCAGKIGE